MLKRNVKIACLPRIKTRGGFSSSFPRNFLKMKSKRNSNSFPLTELSAVSHLTNVFENFAPNSYVQMQSKIWKAAFLNHLFPVLRHIFWRGERSHESRGTCNVHDEAVVGGDSPYGPIIILNDSNFSNFFTETETVLNFQVWRYLLYGAL